MKRHMRWGCVKSAHQSQPLWPAQLTMLDGVQPLISTRACDIHASCADAGNSIKRAVGLPKELETCSLLIVFRSVLCPSFFLLAVITFC